jgi:hypothetical protein
MALGRYRQGVDVLRGAVDDGAGAPSGFYRDSEHGMHMMWGLCRFSPLARKD